MNASGPPTLCWFRHDLRVADNPALLHAASLGGPVIPVLILDDGGRDPWQPGGAGRWWLHHSLRALSGSLTQRGSRLILRRGDPGQALAALARETGAQTVAWNRTFEPFKEARDGQIADALNTLGLKTEAFNGSLLLDPGTLKTASGGPFRVFTPFWKACRAHSGIQKPCSAPQHLTTPQRWPDSDELDQWRLLPTSPDWAGGLRDTWIPGESHALARLSEFLDRELGAYSAQRDRPDTDGTSRLSASLHWGEIGPRQIWSAVHDRLHAGEMAGHEGQAESFLRELVWREFSYNLLIHFPRLPDAPLDPKFAGFPWSSDYGEALAAWQQGRTGYPLVDAGMRQLYATGWMHNRVRMVAASLLIKHLLIPWQEGEAWFWDTLVDADLANNAASWQWVAGSGADAAPYFRIFNPILQGSKFDPKGDYVRTWVPELAGLPAKWIHQPWTAPGLELEAAGVRLGKTYPWPIVDHAWARRRALDAFGATSATNDTASAANRQRAP